MKKLFTQKIFTKKTAAVMLCAVMCLLVMPQLTSAKVVGVDRVTGLKATSTTAKSIVLQWNVVKGATGYQIYRATSKDGEYSLLYTMTSGNHAFKNTSVESGTAYYYTVRAFVKDGKDINYGKYSKQMCSFTKMTSKKKVKTVCAVNLRKHAGTKYSRVTTIPSGKKVKLFYTTRDKNNVKWSRVDYTIKGKTYRGFIRADLAK